MDTEIFKTLYKYDKKLADDILQSKTEFSKIYENNLNEINELKDTFLNDNRNVTLTSREEVLKKQEEAKTLKQKISEFSYPKHILNPLSEEKISGYYKEYLRMCPTKPKAIFFGMNPGLNGMPVTGIPFGNITTAKYLGIYKEDNNVSIDDLMKDMDINDENQEEKINENPCGKLLWTTIFELVDKDTFFKECFVLNLCPLVYFDEYFKVVTQAELEGYFKKDVEEKCIDKTDEILNLLQPDYVVAFGRNVHNIIKRCKYNKPKIYVCHPSPRGIRSEPEWKEDFKDLFEIQLKIEIKNVQFVVNSE